MADFRDGLVRAISEVVGGMLIYSVFSEFVKAGELSPIYLILLTFFNLVTIVFLFEVFPYWSTVYLLGWLYGSLVMFDGGLIGFIELLLYLTGGAIVLKRRFSND